MAKKFRVENTSWASVPCQLEVEGDGDRLLVHVGGELVVTIEIEEGGTGTVEVWPRDIADEMGLDKVTVNEN